VYGKTKWFTRVLWEGGGGVRGGGEGVKGKEKGRKQKERVAKMWT